MVINSKTTQLAFFLTVFLVFIRVLLYLAPIAPLNLDVNIYYLLSFLAEISYLIILCYLISLVWILGYKNISIPLAIILLAEVAIFSFATFFKPADRDTAKLFSTVLAGLSGLLFIAELWLLIATLRIKNNAIITAYRIYASTLLLAHIGNTVLTIVFAFSTLNQAEIDTNYFRPEYVRIIYLLPVLTIFFILQKVKLWLNNDKLTE